MYINYNNRIFGLDVVRAAAILFVLCSHSTLLLFPEESHIILTLIQFLGAIGVDLFFVLSGFLIGAMLIKQIDENKIRPKDFFHFLVRRWFKTLPNYFLILLLNIIVFYLFNKTIINSINQFFFFLHNIIYPMPNFFTESWSLSIEEFAYILVPVLLLLSINFFKSVRIHNMFIVVTLIVIIAVFLTRVFFYFNNDITSYKDWSSQVRKVVIYRIDSIYYGFLAAYIASKFSLIWNRYKRVAFVLGLIVFFIMHSFIFLLNMQPQTYPLFYIVFYLPVLSISLLLLFPVFSNWKKGVVLKKEITTISLLSYALYLVNYSFILLSIQEIFNMENFSAIAKLGALLLYWFLSFFFAYILYVYFEKPIMNLRDSKYIRNCFIN